MASFRAILFCAALFSMTTDLVTGQESHECQRVCRYGEPPRRCRYEFHVEYYFTMSKACFDCPVNTTDCDRHHCIAADGVERGIVVINRQLPGPSVQVCQGDEVIVDLKNHLLGEASSIHWHGLYMRDTPYMDGVPMVTQCPVTSGSTFRYRFTAANAGTHFWHSHTGFQRADGVFGSFIVRQSAEQDPQAVLYDFDLPEHVILVSDWLGELGMAKFVAHHHDDGDNKPPSMIVNGKGRVPKPAHQLTANETMPLSRFSVQKGHRYRFRIISNGFLNCPIQVSVDNHTLLVITSDGIPLQPLIVDSFVISAGERYDFVLAATQPVDTYWIRFHGLMDCNVNEVFQAAILHYEGAPDAEPTRVLTYNNTMRPGKMLNPVNLAPGNDQYVTSAELKSFVDNDLTWTGEPDKKFYLAYDFNAVNNLDFHDPEHYPIFGVEKNHRLYTPQINHISLRMPPSPLLSQLEDVPVGVVCNESTVANCNETFCDCTYTLDIPLGSLVELVLIDEGFTFDATHPFHMHGTSFHVVAMNRLGSNVTVDQIKDLDRLGLISRNLVDAPIKDTVSVPDGGYTIVRFVADNPGYWLFHCHLSFHIEVGMGLVFKIGEPGDWPAKPSDFPKCGNWLPSVDDDDGDDDDYAGVELAPDARDSNDISNDLAPLLHRDDVNALESKSTNAYLDISISHNHLGNLSHSEPTATVHLAGASASVHSFSFGSHLVIALSLYFLLQSSIESLQFA